MNSLRLWKTAPLAGALALLSAAGCGPTDSPDAAVLPDAHRDDTRGPGFDAGPPSGTAEDCDDGVGCTEDLCEEGLCLHQVDPASCDDGIFCNGQETCDPRRDCVAGPRESCDVWLMPIVSGALMDPISRPSWRRCTGSSGTVISIWWVSRRVSAKMMSPRAISGA